MRFNIERACQQIDLHDELFLRHFRRHKKIFKRKLPHDLDSDLFRSLIRAIHMKTHKIGADE